MKTLSPLIRPGIRVLLGMAERAGQWSFFPAVRRGLAFSLPLVMVGAIVVLLRNFPSTTLQQTLSRWFDGHWITLCDDIITGTFGMASLAVLAGYTSARTEEFNQKNNPGTAVSPTTATVIAIACLLIIIAPSDTLSWRTAMSMDRGLLVALVVATLSSHLFLRLASCRTMQLPLIASGFDPIVRDIMAVTPAAILTILVFCALRAALLLSGWGDLHYKLSLLLLTPFANIHNELGFALGYVGLTQILWFFGIHGPNLLYIIEERILTPASLANADSLLSGMHPVHILSKEFFDDFTRMGGSGNTLCLLLALFIASRNRGVKRFSLLALLPALCNVNEPLLFGLPLILNPVYLVPFLLAPLSQTLIAYGATAAGWIPCTAPLTPWTSPVLMNVYMNTGSMQAVLVQVIGLTIGTLIYLPFVRLANRVETRRGLRLLARLQTMAEQLSAGHNGKTVISCGGEIGRLAETLAYDLDRALRAGDQLFLAYQPQVDSARQRIIGVEALLRWRHPVYGPISPPLIVAIAEDMGWINRLGQFILDEACRQRVAWHDVVPAALKMSVNISPLQLLDPHFSDNFQSILRRHGASADLLEIEITETTLFQPSDCALNALHTLRAAGVQVALDDFGMGHTSLRYLQDLPIDTIKIDRSLTQGEIGEVRERIIRSIIALSDSLHIDTIVEGVETNEQLMHFTSFGCSQFQGYLFSRPLSPQDCQHFIDLWSQAPQIDGYGGQTGAV